MTHEERAFRRGLQHGYQLAVVDVLAGASPDDMKARDQAIQDWRNTGTGQFPPDMPSRSFERASRSRQNRIATHDLH